MFTVSMYGSLVLFLCTVSKISLKAESGIPWFQNWEAELLHGSRVGDLRRAINSLRAACALPNHTLFQAGPSQKEPGVGNVGECHARLVTSARDASFRNTAVDVAAHAGHQGSVEWLLALVGCPSQLCAEWLAVCTSSGQSLLDSLTSSSPNQIHTFGDDSLESTRSSSTGDTNSRSSAFSSISATGNGLLLRTLRAAGAAAGSCTSASQSLLGSTVSFKSERLQSWKTGKATASSGYVDQPGLATPFSINCWTDGKTFDECCSLSRNAREPCWQPMEQASFEKCCVDTVFQNCSEACGTGDRPLLAGITKPMCAGGWVIHACNVGGTFPQMTMYTQWSPSYIGFVSQFLGSLQRAGDPVRVVLRRVMDSRNVSTGVQMDWGEFSQDEQWVVDGGDQFEFGLTGYERQRSVRSRFFRTIIHANWHGVAIVTDTDVEYFPGWLEVAQRCIRTVDICGGQQAGWYDERRDFMNPGFLVLRGNERTLRLFSTMLEYRQEGMIQLSEVMTFNRYLNTYPAHVGGPRWACFHPEVVLTGSQSLGPRPLRVRVFHIATGIGSLGTKDRVARNASDTYLLLRQFCPGSSTKGRFPAHPVCLLAGDFAGYMKSGQPIQDHRVGGWFIVQDAQDIYQQLTAVQKKWILVPEWTHLLEVAHRYLALHGVQIGDLSNL